MRSDTGARIGAARNRGCDASFVRAHSGAERSRYTTENRAGACLQHARAAALVDRGAWALYRHGGDGSARGLVETLEHVPPKAKIQLFSPRVAHRDILT